MGTRPEPDLRSLQSIIEGVATRWVTLLGAVADGDRPVPNLEWSITELTAHVVSVAEAFHHYVTEQVSPPVPYSELDQLNRDRIARIGGRPVPRLADRLRTACSAFLEATRWMEPDDPFPWFDDTMVDVAAGYGLLAGELLVHGLDLARALDLSWPIPATEARHATIGLVPAIPASVDPERAAGVTAHIRIRLWGGPTFGVRIDRGGAEITDGTGPADVTIWAHPTTFMLTSYGRISPWRAALTGRTLAWGRKPWLAFQLPELFRV